MASTHEDARREAVLGALGLAVRARRKELGLGVQQLAERAGLSPRFLSQLEHGEGNISVARLWDVAEALSTSASELLRAAEPSRRGGRHVALLGLRGAGKSSVGAALARSRGARFVELDQLVEESAGMSLEEVFELQGWSAYRRLERDALTQVLQSEEPCVVATGGSIVTEPESFARLRRSAVTVWLKARPEDHMQRVRAQGDERPMHNRADAMSELRALLRQRSALYAQADHVLYTSGLDLQGVLERLEAALE